MLFSENSPILREALLSELPAEWPHDLSAEIRRHTQAAGRKLVVLDDDPTGTQTVHDVWVLTQWTPQALRPALGDDNPLFYILTNSRSLPEQEAVALNREIATNLATVSRELGCDFDVISRSDSTLRGHFPAEINALQTTLEPYFNRRFDGILICPFFLEGHRVTAADIHWVAEEDRLTPAALTEFARDVTFGYTQSNLRKWVEEKTRGQVPAAAVISLSLDVIRSQGPKGVYHVLRRLKHGQIGVINALTYRDLSVVVAGLLRAEADGQRFLFRTAASFVKVRGAVGDRDLLAPDELVGPGLTGGLVVVGSYVQKSTRQLQRALELPELVSVELRVQRILDPATRREEIGRVAQTANQALQNNQEAIVFTSRDLETPKGRAGDLDIGERVSSALVEMIRRIQVSPRFIIAKGGITASDIATHGLNVQRARVMGQILPGVPVWRLEAESRYPGLSYVIFPGNVGTDDSLADTIRILRTRP
ncbi:hypothetical protein N9174_01645 [bacterium]|nr:hypothetical protein [bacterium]